MLSDDMRQRVAYMIRQAFAQPEFHDLMLERGPAGVIKILVKHPPADPASADLYAAMLDESNQQEAAVIAAGVMGMM